MGAGYDAMPAGHAVMGAGTRAACAPNPQHAHVIPAPAVIPRSPPRHPAPIASRANHHVIPA